MGCGPGNSTILLRDEFANANIVGIDSSEEMLNQARKMYPQLMWKLEDIAHLSSNADLIFSNAALQWLPNHEQLFPHLFSMVNNGGVFATQMPCNFSYPSHMLLRETIKENSAWQSKLAHIVREQPILSETPVYGKSAYYDILVKNAKYIDIWETEYLQQLAGENAVLEWVKGTALSPVRNNLSLDEYDKFIDIYNTKLLKEYPQQDNGITLFPFKRLFIIAMK